MPPSEVLSLKLRQSELESFFSRGWRLRFFAVVGHPRMAGPRWIMSLIVALAGGRSVKVASIGK